MIAHRVVCRVRFSEQLEIYGYSRILCLTDFLIVLIQYTRYSLDFFLSASPDRDCNPPLLLSRLVLPPILQLVSINCHLFSQRSYGSKFVYVPSFQRGGSSGRAGCEYGKLAEVGGKVKGILCLTRVGTKHGAGVGGLSPLLGPVAV